jgi:hypothetical protein
MFPEYPVYPLRLVHENGEVIELRDEDHVALYLEFFNSDDSRYLRRWRIAQVTDKLGRPVSLVVDRCEITRLELREKST